MKQGFVKVAAVTPNMRVADVEYNVNEICRMIDETTEQGAKVIAFPELCLPDTRVETCSHRKFFCVRQNKDYIGLQSIQRRKMHLFLWESLMKSRESFIIQQRH